MIQLMSRRDRDFRQNKPPQPARDTTPWVAPTFAERQAAKNVPSAEPRVLTIDQELNIAVKRSSSVVVRVN